MQIYLLKYYRNDQQKCDTLVFRSKRNAIKRFKLLHQSLEEKYNDVEYVNNDGSFNRHFMMSISYGPEGDRRRHELTQQITED